MESNPPNILFLMTDQHRADGLGYAGDSIAHTPTLDTLAEGAVRFKRAYTPSPVCVPGRQCMMSGKYPWNCGCRNYGDDLPPFSNTFAAALAAAGYETVCAGKLHHMGTDQMQGWTRRIGMDTEVNWNHRGLEDTIRSRYSGPRPWNIEKELERAGVGTSPYEIEDRYAVDGACHFIREYFTSPFYERQLAHRPLLLKVSLVQPHYPFCCPAELMDKYMDRVPEPDIRPVHSHPALNGHPGPVSAPLDHVRRARAAYYGMIEQTDRQFARVIESLKAAGQDLDEWIIIFTSDHGELLGDHHHWWKHKLLEKSVRVPLFIRTPTGKRNIDCEQVVSLCDLYATLCELAGLTVPPGLDSRSLIPLLNGDNTWGDIALSEVFGKYRMVVESHYKYVLSKEGDRALFDMTKAFPEANDLLNEPSHRQAANRLQAILEEISWKSSS